MTAVHKIKIPHGAENILKKLHDNGYEAYVVGGCVRDSLLGLIPNDWDICTSSSPEKVEEILSELDCRIVETGLKHGTVTAVLPDGDYEVTTFRRDGEYRDNRRPESVEFVSDLKEDLSRRDFTINAMAYSDETGVIDCFGGINDLEKKRIACVGNPDDRFAEDALRIMRAVRFASKYGFEIAESTAESVNKNRERLNNIAAERIQTELVKLLFGKGAENILLEYSDVLSVIIPEIAKCVGFEQNNPHHIFDVYGHTVKAVAAYGGEDVSVKIALLLHDIGKPDCYTEQDGVGHFYGHAKISREIARGVLNRLRFDNKTRSEALELIEYHDDVIELTEKSVRRRLAKMGEARLRQLIEVKKADIKAQTPEIIEERLLHCDKLIAIIDGVVAKEQCFSIKNLAINGRDIISLGAKEGKEIGATLEFLLDKVINGDLKNEADILKAEALKYLTTVQM